MNTNRLIVSCLVLGTIIACAGCTGCTSGNKFYPEKEYTPDPAEPTDPTDPEEPATYYTRYVDMRNAEMAEKLDMASRVVPTEQQLAWQQLELTAFVCITVNTFTGLEWGTGKESPDDFAPTALNTDQWVEALKEAGFKLVILTAKHHDGFCLWPTATTKHSVKYSKWMDGQGDVVRMLRESCDKYGMKLGLYVSPWDRNAESYGQGDGSAYDEFFMAQLTELLNGDYGQIDEVWFDGANGSAEDGKYQTYAWAKYIELVNRLQPQVVISNMGNDVRWVGNEAGWARDEEWSVVAKAPNPYQLKNPTPTIAALTNESEDLGSRAILAEARELYWYPAEVDVSIRPGWFYHAEEDSKVKSLADLQKIYFESVGRNSVLLLNLPPDQRGLLHETDVARLKEFGAWLRETFSQNLLAKGSEAWTAAEGASREFEIGTGSFNVFMIQEDISKGQRVDRFKVEISTDGNTWQELCTGKTIGYKRLIRLPSTQSARKLRVTIEQTRAAAHISNVGLFLSR